MHVYPVRPFLCCRTWPDHWACVGRLTVHGGRPQSKKKQKAMRAGLILTLQTSRGSCVPIYKYPLCNWEAPVHGKAVWIQPGTISPHTNQFHCVSSLEDCFRLQRMSCNSDMCCSNCTAIPRLAHMSTRHLLQNMFCKAKRHGNASWKLHMPSWLIYLGNVSCCLRS